MTSLESRMLDLRTRFVGNLPAKIAVIAESLRERQTAAEPEGKLERQFHNLAGTASTYGLFAIAEAASDGFDACENLDGARIEGDARYLWSIVEELAHEASGRYFPDDNAAVLNAMNWTAAA
jgi:HPt (histidine-containing phosphotransfer) domain-containing protein